MGPPDNSTPKMVGDICDEITAAYFRMHGKPVIVRILRIDREWCAELVDDDGLVIAKGPVEAWQSDAAGCLFRVVSADWIKRAEKLEDRARELRAGAASLGGVLSNIW